MKIFERIENARAIQFNTLDFHKDQMRYPMVFDKAMFSKEWLDKKAVDGRYYILNHTNTNPFSSVIGLAEGDYVIAESTGWYYTMPQEVFERVYTEKTLVTEI